MPLNPSNTLRAVRIPPAGAANVGRDRSRPASAYRATIVTTSNSGMSSNINAPITSSARPSSVSRQQTKTVSSILGHGATSASGNLSSQESYWFDKYHKLHEEHMQVKQERKDQDQRLTDITTKFRRVTRDLKLSGFNENEASSVADEVLAPYLREIHQLKDRLSATTLERDHARAEASELRRLLGMRPSGMSSSSSNAAPPSKGGHGTNFSHAHSTSSASGGGGGVVDVTSLLNQRQSEFHRPSASPSSNVQQQQHQLQQQQQMHELQQLRSTLHDEISRNERLSQHCENLRAQLAVASNTNMNVSNRIASLNTPYQTPARVAATTTTVPMPVGSANQQQDQATATIISRLRDENSQLQNRIIEYQNIANSTQREKNSLEQELNLLRQRPSSTATTAMFGVSSSSSSSSSPINQVQKEQQLQQQLAQYSTFATGSHVSNNSNSNSTLQQLCQDLSAQVSHLSQRLEHSQGQVQTLRGECERLLQELKQSHNDIAQARKRAFESEQETSSLRVKAARNDELDAALALKTSELLRCEQELLRLVDKLQSCSRETESQVRLEYSARLADVDSLRDEAERNRRSRERELFSAQQDLAEAKRDAESKTSEIGHLSREIQRLQKQNEELRDDQHKNRVQSVRDASDAQLVQQAVASMMMSKNTDSNTTGRNNNNNNNNNNYSNNVDDIINGTGGGTWNEKWELQQLREQAAQAILDREMAEQRASDFETALSRKNDLMQAMLDERDQLLFENLELRRRLSGVQTCFSRTFNPFTFSASASGRAVNDDKNTNNTLVRIATPGTAVSTPFAAVMVTLTTIALTGSPGLHIASLDGIEGFECGISDPFAVLADGSPTGPSVELPFRFSNIPLDDHTLAQLRESYFNLQVHQVRDGVKSALVAIARMPAGQSIAACLETGSTNSKIELLGGDGASIGAASVTVSVDSPALPLALLPPVDAKASAAVRLGFASASTDPDAMRSLLLAMRAVRGVRVQIVRCSNLRNSSDPQRIPTPYVFYTSSLDRSADWPLAHIIADTAVHTRTRAVTSNPVFDCEPKDFIFRVFDQQVAAFFRHAKLSFVVYDINCENPEQNLGMASVSLAPMLQSSTATMIENEISLGQYGTISFIISWIR